MLHGPKKFYEKDEPGVTKKSKMTCFEASIMQCSSQDTLSASNPHLLSPKLAKYLSTPVNGHFYQRHIQANDNFRLYTLKFLKLAEPVWSNIQFLSLSSLAS